VSYKDRSAGLMVFGIMTILLGCLAGLMIVLMLFALAVSPQATKGQLTFSTIVPAIAVYGVAAVVLIWLGIGSIQARRWARALMLIFSWSWLIMGMIGLAVMVFVLPKTMANLPSNSANGDAAVGVVLVFSFLIMGVMFVVLPAIWTFFYHSRHVKATCEARDPATRWTDACPLPVLAFSLWLLFSVVMMLVAPLTGHTVMPFFGMFLTGLPGILFCLVLAAIWGFAAWSLYKLERRGWWLILIVMWVLMPSAFLTYAQHDVTEMYQLMGYPEAQIEQMQKIGLWSGNRMMWLMALSMAPFMAYLFFIKKYLPGKPQKV
jgi:hypothetical protein